MAKILQYLPELAGEELTYIAQIFKEMSDDEAEQFAKIYRLRRRDPTLVLISALGGLFLLPGLQRFIVNQIGMGILYLFTIGLCFIGSIVDVINYQKLALEYNSKVAQEVLLIMNNDFELTGSNKN